MKALTIMPERDYTKRMTIFIKVNTVALPGMLRTKAKLSESRGGSILLQSAADPTQPNCDQRRDEDEAREQRGEQGESPELPHQSNERLRYWQRHD